jgi:hypothetical protein
MLREWTDTPREAYKLGGEADMIHPRNYFFVRSRLTVITILGVNEKDICEKIA